MGSMRRAFLGVLGRPQASRLKSLGVPRAAVCAPASRSLATSSAGPRAPSKWPKRLLIGAAVVGLGTYMLREPPQRAEQRRLVQLGDECVKNGDFGQATKYFSQSFGAVKDLLTPGEMIKQACWYAAVCESLNQHEAALPYYQTAMKRLKEVNPISVRCVDGVKLMDRMALCYHHIGRHETAEKAFKQAIRMYEKYRGEFSDSATSPSRKRLVVKLDGNIVNVFLHYAQLMASMERDGEVSLMRQRLAELVRSSSSMQSVEPRIMDQFDDLMALHAIREERHRGRGEGHNASF